MDEKWYRNPDLLRAAKDEYGSLTAAASAIGGVDTTTLTKWWNRLGLEKLSRGPAPGTPNQDALQRLYDRVRTNK